jgi:hypothetical protein
MQGNFPISTGFQGAVCLSAYLKNTSPLNISLPIVEKSLEVPADHAALPTNILNTSLQPAATTIKTQKT